MTISSITRVAGPYAGTGAQVIFSFAFKVFANTDMVVVQTDNNGVSTTQVLTTNYTVSLNADQNANPGGTITMLVAPPTGFQLTITSAVPQLQPTDIANVGNFYPKAVTDAFDRATIQIQQIQTQVNQSLQIPLNQLGVTSTALPAPVALNLLGWNAGANAIQNFNSSSIAASVIYGSAIADVFTGNGALTVFTLSNVPGSLATMDVSVNGVTKIPTIDYTWTPGTTTLTMTAAVPNGQKLLVRYVLVLPLGSIDQTGVVNSVFNTPDYAGLRAFSGNAKNAYVTGYRGGLPPLGIAGQFTYDPSDTTSADNGGTIIVDGTNRRWKRAYAGALNVQWFGAIPGLVTDCTAAVNACLTIAYAAGLPCAVYFPVGQYLVSSTIDVSHPMVNIFGDGRRISEICSSFAGVAVQFTDANPNNGAFAFGGQISNIGIRGNASTTMILRLKNVNHFSASNVNLREANTASGYGLALLGGVGCNFSNVYCSTNEQLMTNRPFIGLWVDRDPTSLARATDNTFENCYIEGMLGDGIQLQNSDQSFIMGGSSENNSGDGLNISAGSRMNTVISMGFENTIGFADIYDNGYGNKFLNCYTKSSIYVDTASLMSRIEGGFHQNISINGDFATVQDLKFSFFSAGGAVTVKTNTSSRNLYNANTSALVFKAKAAAAITVTASPFIYDNGTGMDQCVTVHGGTVTQIVLRRGGSAVTNVALDGMFYLAPGDGLQVNYTVVPTMVSIPYGTNFL